MPQIRAKLIIQELWISDHNWDQQITPKLFQKWKSIAKDLYQATEINIPRCYFSNNPNTVTLHAFADASEKAHGGVIYLTSNDESMLIMAKTRVSPIKLQTLTLPRLELMAALVATRLSEFVTESLSSKYNITKRILWSDSQITLHWLKGRGKQDIFTRNRVAEINTVDQELKYVPTSDNPADLLTRGITPKELKSSQLWWKGPPWITDPQLWPTCDLFDAEIDTTEKSTHAINHLAAKYATSTLEPKFKAPSIEIAREPTNIAPNISELRNNIGNIFNTNNYRDLQHLLRVTSYVTRFIQCLRNSIKRPPSCSDLTSTKSIVDIPSANEMRASEMLWVIGTQQSRYALEIQGLQRNAARHRAVNKQLKLFVDEHNVLRAGGRLQNTDLPYNAIHPILLPGDHPFTRLIIQDAHVRLHHAGSIATTTNLRQHYWITSIRRHVNNVIHRCVTCRKVDGLPYARPVSAPMPAYRVQQANPFAVCGVDYTGHLFVKDQRNGTLSKVYICLFTCGVTRAIHLELVPDLTTESFIQALRRFAARRSTPKLMISDNSSTFLSAASELNTLMSNPTVSKYLADHRITWKFIPKRSPWWGGLYERLIAMTKTSLKKTLCRSCISYMEMSTVLTEIEATLNDRPLTHLSSSINDLLPLTPSHLLNGYTIQHLPREAVTDFNPNIPSNLDTANRRYRYLTSLKDSFWRRWSLEYVTALRERHMNQVKGVKTNTVKVGDICLIHDDVRKRIHWRMARITKLLPGPDGITRAVELMTKFGPTNRAISLLYPLELNAEINDDIPTRCEDISQTNDTEIPMLEDLPRNDVNISRPRRQAAEIASSRITQQYEHELV